MLPLISGLVGAIPAVAGVARAMSSTDAEEEARRRALEASQGRGAGSLAAERALGRDASRNIGIARSVPGQSAGLAARQAALATSDTTARAMPLIAQQRQQEREQGTQQLLALDNAQRDRVVSGLGAIAGAGSQASAFLSSNPLGAPGNATSSSPVLSPALPLLGVPRGTFAPAQAAPVSSVAEAASLLGAPSPAAGASQVAPAPLAAITQGFSGAPADLLALPLPQVAAAPAMRPPSAPSALGLSPEDLERLRREGRLS
jgi:hypothetical protein